MRSVRSWPVRIPVAVILISIGALIDHYVTHRSFFDRVILGGSILGPMLLLIYLDERAQRRRTRAQQQSSNMDERDAPAG